MPAFWNRIRAFCWREPNCRLMGVDPHFFGGSLVVQNLHASIIFRKKKVENCSLEFVSHVFFCSPAKQEMKKGDRLQCSEELVEWARICC